MTITLSSIKTSSSQRPPRVCVYGVGGIGKTTFASKAPKPVFLFTEDGVGDLEVDAFNFDDQGRVVARHWHEALGAVQALYNEDHDYQTLVIDSLDFLESLIHKAICERDGHENVEDYGYGKGYVVALREMETLFGWLDALRDRKGMTVVLVAHSEVRACNDPETSTPYDRYQISLHKNMAALVQNWCDAVFFANYRKTIVQPKKGTNEKTRAVGRGERAMFTTERPAYWAKNRYSLPDEMELSWEAFQSHRNNTQGA